MGAVPNKKERIAARRQRRLLDPGGLGSIMIVRPFAGDRSAVVLRSRRVMRKR
jgi:hypothetical protein